MVRLGAASINVSISDADGFRVTHGSTGDTIFHKAPENCTDKEWNELFTTLEAIGGPNLLERI